MAQLEVIKTLLIGIGTTGTKTCLAVAERVGWEYGDITRAPWIRYLCLETDSNTRQGPLPEECMLRLSIKPEEYEQVLQFGRAYDEFMDLSLWADEATLKMIPHSEVEGGAGNIRMVGRLALLFPRNFRMIRNQIESNLNTLRKLDAGAAQEALGTLPDGSVPTILFRAGGHLRIFVVGSLCGGTCSGIASDLGFLIGRIKQPEEKVVGIFGLPRPNLSSKMEANAERYKVNAYTALTELNHYHLPIGKPPIKAGEETITTTGAFPYDATYIAMPDATGSEARDRLIVAMADRVFLNTSVAEVDPFGKLADATITDRENHAHVFCTFGISTIEFPRQRVIEGCTKRLLLKALREWSKPDTDGTIRANADSTARSLGLQADQIIIQLRKTDKEQDILSVLNGLVEKIQGCQTQAEASHTVHYTRAVLGTGSAVPAAEAGPRPGDLSRWVSERVNGVAKQCANRIRSAVERALLDTQGITKAQAVLDATEAILTKLESMKPVNTEPERQAVDEAVDALRERKPWLPWQRKRWEESLQRTAAALRNEISVSVDAHIRAIISGHGGNVGPLEPVVAQCRQQLKPVRVRLENLRVRIGYAIQRLDTEVQALNNTLPTLNGQAIFSAGDWEGTVGLWYKRELGKIAGDETLYERAETQEAKAIPQTWTELPPLVARGGESDWLLEPPDPDEERQIPRAPYERMLSRARQPFSSLTSRSIGDELAAISSVSEIVAKAADQTRELVTVDDALATRGGRTPISTRTVMLVPAQVANKESLVRLARAAFQDDLEVASAPDTSRIAFLRERLRFPLYGAPAVVASSGSLAQAECNDFPLFCTRKDVGWSGLSEKEHTALVHAEEILVVAILLECVTLQGGKIRVPRNPTKLGDKDYEELPFSLAEASRLLNPHRSWASKASTSSSLLRNLEHAVNNKRSSMTPEEFVRAIKRAYEESGLGQQLPDWSEKAGKAFRRYCSREEPLYNAYRLVFPPSADLISLMRREAGEARPTGGTYPRSGLYCIDQSCCGWVGADEREAAMNGWRCFICGKDCDPS